MERKLTLDRYKCVSFDLFDTLINRDIADPKDIFLICEQAFYRKYGESGIKKYALVRTQCEQAIRARQETEVTYDQIFQEMGKYSDKETIGKYKELEIQAEIDFSTVNVRGKQLYEQVLKSGKRIIITTDMYLPRVVVESILEKNGYCGYSAIYLSSELGLTKAKGDVYEHILKKENVTPGELLHIGDNLKSDILNARIKGIQAYYLKKQKHNKKIIIKPESVDNSLAFDVLSTFFHNRKKTENSSEYAKVGYTCLGPLLFGFLNWLDMNCAENRIEHILFFSRDGYLMKKLYEQMERKSDASIIYFYASRRALQVAALCLDPTYEAAIHAMNFPKQVKISWLLNSWGLDVTQYLTQIESLQLSSESEFNREELPNSKKLKELFDLLKQDIINNSERECHAFLKYLQNTACQGRIAIVDIGWNGNMQKAFEKIIRHFGLNITVQGYYLGIVPTSPNQFEYDMRGYLFQEGKNEELFLKERYINCLLEMFLVAPHGSVRRYYTNGTGSVEIEQEIFEYKNSSIYCKIKTLQSEAERFVRDFSKVALYIENDELVYSRNLMDQFLFPTNKTAEYWGKFQMWDGGWVSLIKSKERKHRWEYLIHPRSFLDDFMKSSWKIGFLKQIFGLRLPYVDMLILLRKGYERIMVRSA